MKWQPIETAPKDGSEMLVWEMFGGWFVAKWSLKRKIWVSVWSCMEFDEIEPTHWMPLPDQPEDYEPTEAQQGLIPIPDGYKEP